MGIEPTLSAWKAEVLPLNYTRKTYLLTIRIEAADGGIKNISTHATSLGS